MKFIAVFCLIFSSVAWSNSFTVDFRNDLWTRPQTDRYLTNVIGVKIKHEDLYDFVKFFLPDFEADQFITRVAQDMYTPEDIDSYDKDPIDRPYAGHLYLEITKVNFEGDIHHYTTVQIGVIGPMALAAEAQEIVHDWTGSTEANGWKHQLKNELGLNISRLIGKKTTLYAHGDMRVTNITYGEFGLGNVKTYARVGTQFTAGYNPPQNDSLYDMAAASGKSPWSAYIETNLYSEAVAWDMFINGNTSWFGDRTELERENIVNRFDAAMVFRYRKFYLKFSQSIISEQFKGQDGRHQYGQVLLQYRTDTESVMKWFQEMAD